MIYCWFWFSFFDMNCCLILKFNLRFLFNLWNVISFSFRVLFSDLFSVLIILMSLISIFLNMFCSCFAFEIFSYGLELIGQLKFELLVANYFCELTYHLNWKLFLEVLNWMFVFLDKISVACSFFMWKMIWPTKTVCWVNQLKD